MKIKSFEVQGLFGLKEKIKIRLNEDLNILSGRNGSGKTTVMKLMWYLISGNFDKALAEIEFTSAILVTDKYDLNVKIDLNNKEKPLISKINFYEKNNLQINDTLSEVSKKYDDVDWYFPRHIGSSFFFPTFRIIEGGFSTQSYNIKHDVIKEFYLKFNEDDKGFGEANFALTSISKRNSKEGHKFVTNISTDHIDILISMIYMDVLEKQNAILDGLLEAYNRRIELSNQITEDFKKNTEKNISTIYTMDEKISTLKVKREENNIPIKKIENLVNIFLKDKNIKFTGKVRFNLLKMDADAPEEAMLLTKDLSAGEKQILTFIIYNAFYNNTIFFIDEPELSLHTDWQRILFRMLKKQNSTNQFIISTHSPFIYSKYPDKEICIDSMQDRGNNQGYVTND